MNPVIPDIGMSDPHVRVFGGKAYLYCGHDGGPDDPTWVMKEWRVFSSTDLVEWTLETVISPEDNYMDDDSEDCWAADAAQRNGTTYFYFSDRKRGVGVMTSSAPGGPFRDALGAPLVSPMHDPTLLLDDDAAKTPYLVYGDKAGGGFHAARLNDDMVSLAHNPVPIEIHGREWDAAPAWMDKNYVFKHDGVYYLSWGRDHARSKSIYGPYECAGAVGEGHHLDEFAHGSFFWWKGQLYHMWSYYLTKGRAYRESIITYCHIDDEGRVVTDTRFLDQHFATGVGQVDASWERIEAEWYHCKSPAIRKTGTREHGFRLTDMGDGDSFEFAKVSFPESAHKLDIQVSRAAAGGVLEVRIWGVSGTMRGTAELASTDVDQTASAAVAVSPGIYDIALVYRGASRISVDWIRFL